MDKNSIIGIVLMAAVLFGFTFIQQNKYRKQMAEQARLDSIARAEHPELYASDTIDYESAASAAAEKPAQVRGASSGPVSGTPVFKDAALQEAYGAEESFVTLENDKFEVKFTTKGAQPYSVRIKDYYNHDSTDLYIFRPGRSKYAVNVYAGEYINTDDFVFNVVQLTDNVVVMQLPFSNGGYIEQSYQIEEGSYMVANCLSFKGMDSVIPRNVSSVDIDFEMVIPRMEKGYKYESQYSKLDYYFEGDKKVSEIGRGRSASKTISSKMDWFAFQQQFFSAIVRADNRFDSGDLAINFAGADDPDGSLMACSAKMRMELPKGTPDDMSLGFDLYYGPNHYQTLKAYDQKYEKIIPLGGSLVGWFTKFVIIPLFNFFHRYFSNFGIIILLMTLVIKLVVLPFTYKSYSSSAKMNALKPEVERINAKYPKQEDAMKKQQATMDLYRKAGASPMGGCLPMLLTFPILWAMFRFFPASIELRQQPFLWCHDLSSYDAIIEFGHRIPILGDHVSLFALLMAVTMWGYSKLTTANQTASNDPNAASMKFMSVWMMPIMMYFICNSLSAALSYYYLLSQLISIIETLIIRRSIKPEDVIAKVRAAESQPQKKSKWQQRLEEAQKMQQAQLREREKKLRR
ncbi:MAG: membrane protein insertase YidC [Bacteroidales bacterium]|nr:membrane protein insertase YidC [Bacteroidales bacterium]